MMLRADTRKYGIIVPLGALRSEACVGVGEYPDLAALGKLCRKAGASYIQLLPVNDSGTQSSPYSALSAFALHPLYLRLSDLPEARDFQADIQTLRLRFEGADRFSYPEILEAKMSLLRRMYAASPAPPGDASLEAWIKSNPWVREYAVFLRLKGENQDRSWKDWTGHRDPLSGEIAGLWSDASLRGEHLFYAWVQMRCEEQFLAASRSLNSDGVALKGDLPILMNDDSADVWAHRSWFRMDRIAGAPPDMFSELGQNWGFPIYDWETLAKEDYSFWMARLRQAAKFYGAYRIDHVLGFFRIWSLSERDESGYLGSFEPSVFLTRADLREAGFSEDRVRWISRPHIREDALEAAVAEEPDAKAAAARAAEAALDRIGNERLFSFKPGIRGEKDIQALRLPESARSFLEAAWRDRALVETGDESFSPAWRYYSASSWTTLSDSEKGILEDLIHSRGAASEAVWEDRGRTLLAALKEGAAMLPCAEDLGAVPPCVPKVLKELGILGLRIPRWTRRWGQEGDPYIEPGDYPILSVCSPSVHDTSTLRDWWEHEAGPGDRAAAFGGTPPSGDWSPALGERLLSRYASGASTLLSVQLQDILDLSLSYESKDSRSDRVNVPGTVNDVNWTWRVPVSLESLALDDEWLASIRRALAR